MLTLYYLNADRRNATFPHREMLRELGLKWDSDSKRWYHADSSHPVQQAADLLGFGHITVEGATTLPPGPKPRGRAFRRGHDPRRVKVEDMKRGWDVIKTELDNSAEAPPEPEPRAKPIPLPAVDGDAATQLAALVRAIAGSAVDAETVRAMVEAETLPLRNAVEALRATPTRTVTVQLQTLEAPTVVEIDGPVHAILADILSHIAVGFRNFLLVGPSGSGKTTIAKQVSEALKLAFSSVSCSAGMSEGVLLGRLLPTGEAGRFEYSASPLVILYENGGVFLLDEVDAADANTLLVLNSATANGHLDIPNRLQSPTATRHADFILIAAGNTWGNGADRMYVGRNQLDAAFLSRFAGATFDVDYDIELEAALVRANAPDGMADKWMRAAYSVRDKVRAAGMRRVWGTRELLAGCRSLRVKPAVDYALQRLTLGWTADEKVKAGV